MELIQLFCSTANAHFYKPSTCSNHDAVNREKGKDGLAVSGVGAIDCVRHDMKRTASVGDLQKGER